MTDTPTDGEPRPPHLSWSALFLRFLRFGLLAFGGAVGIAWREENLLTKVALALPFMIAGIISLAAGALIWRSFCEFYVAIFRISDDLRFIRGTIERGQPSPLTPVSEPSSAESEAPSEPQRVARSRK